MAKQSSTKSSARSGSTSAAALPGSTPERGATSVRPMLAENLRVQSAAAALRKAVSQPPTGESGESGPAQLARLLTEQDFYPAHDQRSARPQYDQVHKRLCITMDLPCLVCGVRSSTLGDPAENRYGARQMETHHHVIEWELADAVDVGRFNKTIRPHLLARQQNHPVYQHDMSAQEVHDWVDHSEDNLWVLCDIHHRHKFLGIHEIAYPSWCPQDLLRPDFTDYVAERAKHAAAVAPVAAVPVARPKAVKKTTAARVTTKLKVAPIDKRVGKPK